MRQLYWKIFLWFWLTMILIITSIAFLGGYFLRESIIPMRNNTLLSTYANAAVMVYETEGPKALEYWFNQVSKNSGIRAYLVNQYGEDVLESSLSGQLSITDSKLQLNILPNTSYREGRMMVSKVITSQSGMQYRLITRLPSAFSNFTTQNLQLLWLRLLLAIFITGIICYFLSRYLTTPINKLQRAARQIAGGQFSTRVSQAIGDRNDEIGELADEFDTMAERIESLIESQKRLLQDVSHELRTPLARLQVALELARRRSKGLAESELDRIAIESERLNELIGEILSLARLETAEVSLDEHVNITRLMEKTVQDTNFEFKQLNKSAQLHGEEGLKLIGNMTLMQRAFENILRNALRHTQDHSCVDIQIIELKKPHEICITIRDHGPGVPPQALPSLFRPFYRVEDSRFKDTGGYGLGLAIAFKAIELHRGDIKAYNAEEGTGLVVEIHLPLQDKATTKEKE